MMVKDDLMGSFVQREDKFQSPTDEIFAGPTKALLFITLPLISLSV